MIKMKKDNGYYGMSLRIEQNSPISEWLNAQENKSASIKALIAMAIETYGVDEDIITCAMMDSKIGKMVRKQQRLAERAVVRSRAKQAAEEDEKRIKEKAEKDKELAAEKELLAQMEAEEAAKEEEAPVDTEKQAKPKRKRKARSKAKAKADSENEEKNGNEKAAKNWREMM